MRRSRTIASLATLAAGAALVTTHATTASANGVEEDDVTPITTGFEGMPLQFALNANDRAFVAQAFGPGSSKVVKVTPSGARSDAVTDMDGSITGVGFRRGTIAYTFTGGGPMLDSAPEGDVALQGGVASSDILLKLQDRQGDQRVLGDLGLAEETMNPDGFQAYGAIGYRDACGEAPPEEHAPRGGIVENNPYAVAAAPGGGWYVADAAANVIWKVEGGEVAPVTVFKPRGIQITEQIAAANELPECSIGSRYNLEPVPTDVEVAPDGSLFVSLLPGEGISDGAPFMEGLGTVVKVNPRNGVTREVASGFTGATNLALAGDRVFVSELYVDQVSVHNLRTGRTRPVGHITGQAGLEWQDGQLWSTYDAFGAGALGIVQR